MKPFDLEAALRGEPVITRDGRSVTQLTKFDVESSWKPLVGVIDGYYQYWQIDGRSGEKTQSADLFMAPKKRTVWVNLYGADQERFASHYDTQAQADAGCMEGRIGNKAYPIEIEE